MAAVSNRNPNIGLCIELANSLQENKPLADVEQVVQDALRAGESIEELVNDGLYDGPNAYESNFRGASCFHIAVTHNAHEDVIQFLCDQGADLEATNTEGKNALMIAAFHANHAAVKVLLAQDKTDPFALGQFGERALHWACLAGSYECVELILNHEKYTQGEKEEIDWGNDFRESAFDYAAGDYVLRSNKRHHIGLVDQGKPVFDPHEMSENELIERAKIITLLFERGAAYPGVADKRRNKLIIGYIEPNLTPFAEKIKDRIHVRLEELREGDDPGKKSKITYLENVLSTFQGES